MIPYTSIDMLRAMQREWLEDDRRSGGPTAGGPPPTVREQMPDPLGLAFAKLLSGEPVRAGVDRIARLGRLGAHRTA